MKQTIAITDNKGNTQTFVFDERYDNLTDDVKRLCKWVTSHVTNNHKSK